MIKNPLFLTLPGLVLGLMMMACGSGADGEGEGDDSTHIEVTEVDNPSDNEFLLSLPSPLQIASIFRRSGLSYIPELTNNPSNVDNYNTKFVQKLNFGAYSADLAYSALNEKNQACIEYVMCLSKLSESLWMTNIFNSVSILNRFEKNMGNADSISYIMADFQMEMDSYLEENGLSSNSLIIFAGAWVESMHLAFKSVDANYNPQLISRLIEQKKILINLVDVLEKQEKGAETDELITHLKGISSHFDSYNVDNIKDEEALFKLTMTEADVDKVLVDIQKARSFIING